MLAHEVNGTRIFYLSLLGNPQKFRGSLMELLYLRTYYSTVQCETDRCRSYVDQRTNGPPSSTEWSR